MTRVLLVQVYVEGAVRTVKFQELAAGHTPSQEPVSIFHHIDTTTVFLYPLRQRLPVQHEACSSCGEGGRGDGNCWKSLRALQAD